MKKIIILLMFAIVLPSVLAITLDEITSFNVTLGNEICDPGENPIYHPNDCEMEFDFEYAWMWKLVLIIFVLVMIYKRLEMPKHIIIILGVAIILFSMYMPEPQEEVEIVTLNESINETEVPEGTTIIQETFLEKVGNWFSGVAKTISPSRPIVGWVVIILVGWILLNMIGVFGGDFGGGKIREMTAKLMGKIR